MLTKRSKSEFEYIDVLLVLALLAIGGWQMYMAWNNPRHVGWIPSATVSMIGSMACAWLIWKRRGTQRSSLLPIMLVLNSSILVEHILKWQAGEEGPVLTVVNGLLVAFLLWVMTSEEITHRKFLALEAAYDLKPFAPEQPSTSPFESPVISHGEERSPDLPEQATLHTFRRQPHYSFMRPMDFAWFVFLLIANAWILVSLWPLKTHFHAWPVMMVIMPGATAWYAWIRSKRRNLCADSGELLLSVLIPQTFHLIYNQMNHPNSELLLSTCVFAVLLPYIARQVWRAPGVAKKLEEDLATQLHAKAAPRFTHIDTP
jgi:hypothetical protein